MWLTKVKVTNFGFDGLHLFEFLKGHDTRELYCCNGKEKKEEKDSMHHWRYIAEEAHDWKSRKILFLFP